MEPGTLQVASCMSDESPAGSASQDTVTLPETTMPSTIRVYGTVTEINGSQVTISNDNQDDPYSTIILNINEDTLILTAEDCKEKTLKDLQKGDILYAYVSPVMTRSLPPMSNAELLLDVYKRQFHVFAVKAGQSLLLQGFRQTPGPCA